MSCNRNKSQVEEDDLDRILKSNYLEKYSSKKDLLRRLRSIFEALRDEDDIDIDDYPGLGGLANLLVTKPFLEHKDKEVRLYTVLACVEIFYAYAPEAPFDEEETIAFFAQMVRQLGNLTNCTSPKQPNYLHYFHLLEQLATVRIGLVLVELCRTMDDNREALDSLVDLVQKLLEVVHIDHAQEVVNHAATAIASILEEFDATIPTPILDVVLTNIASGPVVMATNPAAVEAAAQISARKKSKNKNLKPIQMPPLQIQQSNPSYLVAASAIRKVGEKVAHPIAIFLNGLWNGDSTICDYTSISTDGDASPNVWSTIYEIHKISPDILTTVIGNVASSLVAPEEEMRIKVVKLLGRLFFSPNSKIGIQFSSCFREWLRRHNDVNVEVRMTMAKYLVTILSNKKIELMEETSATLIRIIGKDPDASVRISAIRQVCDIAYKDSSLISTNLLKAVGSRVSSKSKIERKDALTGLSQIYHRHYIMPKLRQVQSGGDDCPIEIIMEALHGESLLEDKYSWIATQVFQCASFTKDVDMRNRVVQIVDEFFLGKDSLSGTSRAVGVGIITSSLEKSSNAFGWMAKLMQERANLQKCLSAYIDARSSLRRCKAGTEEALTADANAMEYLEKITHLMGLEENDREVLEKLHSARDGHIFKIFATIANPSHSIAARARALEDLPKRTKALGDSTLIWVKTLAKRTAMSNFVNVDTMRHIILLSQECLHEGDYEGCAIFVTLLKVVADSYPSIFSKKEDFSNLMEIFTGCRDITNAKAKKEIERLELLTGTSALVASAAKSFGHGNIDSKLEDQLLKLCTKDGTPEQVRHAVQTMAALLLEKDAEISEQEKTFSPLMKALTSPTRLIILSDASKIVCALSGLSALAECAPSLFGTSGYGAKALRFALDTVLLGRQDSLDYAAAEGDKEESSSDIISPKFTRKSRKKNQSPAATTSYLQDDQLAGACRRSCAAIEFLVNHIRFNLISIKFKKMKMEPPSKEHIQQVFRILHQIIEDKGLPQCDRDRSMCKSRQDRAALRECASIQLFRLCDTRLHLVDEHLSDATWHVLSSSLLDEERRVRESLMGELGSMLTGKGAYAVGGSPQPANLRFLAMLVFCVDSDGNSIANGNAANVGKVCNVVKVAAKNGIIRLRKTTEATLYQSRSLGKAAEQNFEKILKKKIMPEYSVPYAIHLLSLRRETPSAGSIAFGVPGGSQFAASDLEEGESEDEVDEGAQQKSLRKRLKCLFEPLVASLGDGADNISFLLRMTDMIGNQFQPVNIFSRRTNFVLSLDSDSNDSIASPSLQEDTKYIAMLTGKMKTICAASRDVLLTFVKKDINLTPYPGRIEVPLSIFRMTKRALEQKKRSPRRSVSSAETSFNGNNSKRGKKFSGNDSTNESSESISIKSFIEKESSNIDGYSRRSRRLKQNQNEIDKNQGDDSTKRNELAMQKKRSFESLSDSPEASATSSRASSKRRKTRVTFSPKFPRRSFQSPRTPQSPDSFGNVSPIKKSDSSPGSSVSSFSVKTAGTTPPSILRSVPTPSSEEKSTRKSPRLRTDAGRALKRKSSGNQTNLSHNALSLGVQGSMSNNEADEISLSSIHSESKKTVATEMKVKQSSKTDIGPRRSTRRLGKNEDDTESSYSKEGKDVSLSGIDLKFKRTKISNRRSKQAPKDSDYSKEEEGARELKTRSRSRRRKSPNK